MSALRAIFARREASIAGILILLFGMIGAFDPAYLSASTMSRVFNSSLILILISLGSMMVITTKGIDVSVGSTLGLSAVVAGISLNAGVSLGGSIGLSLVVGVLAGAFNGALITLLGMPPIVVTLGTLGLYRGLALIATHGTWIERLPDSIKQISRTHFAGLPLFGWITLVAVAIVFVFMRYTSWGRYFYATGANAEGAQLIGIRTRLVVFFAYVVSGLSAAAAGIVFASQIGFIPTQAGNGLELRAIGASVIGGVSLLGGAGTPIGAALGAFFLTAIDSMLVYLKFPGYWNDLIAGSILLLALVLDARVTGAISRFAAAQRYRNKTSSRDQSPPSDSVPVGAPLNKPNGDGAR